MDSEGRLGSTFQASGTPQAKTWRWEKAGCIQETEGALSYQMGEECGLSRKSELDGPKGGLGHGNREPWKALEQRHHMGNKGEAGRSQSPRLLPPCPARLRGDTQRQAVATEEGEPVAWQPQQGPLGVSRPLGTGYRSQELWCSSPVASCVFSDALLDFSVSPFPRLLNGGLPTSLS